ncbi:MAG: FG-GAP repeat protein, partial [Candidatus Thermoplasmatota archaeon]|nr:FG-GAP repeat protein [Candidatus Thermoplasmatota archaeon]
HYFDYNQDGIKDLFISDSCLFEPGHIEGMILGFDGNNISGKHNFTYLDYDFRILPEYYTINYHYTAFGGDLCIHDFDGDGFDDIIFTDSSGRMNRVDGCGVTIVMYNNGTHLEGNYSVSEFQTTWIYGNGGDYFGGHDDSGMDIGDINNDGNIDLIISGSGADGINNEYDRSGEIAILYQKPERPQTIDLSVRSNIDVSIIGQTGIAIGFGVVSTGDYNGDGYDDILFSNDATYSVAWDGGVYLWLGREIQSSVYSLSTCKFLFKGQSGTEMERYGYRNAFANINGDEYMDLIISPDRGDFTDIFFSANNPPNILNVTFEKSEVYRGQINQMVIEFNDDRTTAENMTVKVQYRSIRDWINVTLLSIDNSNNKLLYDIQTNYSSHLGNYSYRVRLTDQDDLTTGWSYYNNSVYVKNNKPTIWDEYSGPGDVGRGFPNRFGFRVNDPETPINEMNFTYRIVEPDVYFYDLTPNRMTDGNRLYFEVIIPKDFDTGFFHFEIFVTDGDGDMVKSDSPHGFNIFNWTLAFNDYSITHPKVNRGNSTNVTFKLFDNDDRIDDLYNISLDFIHVSSGRVRTFIPFFNGTDYERLYHANITAGLDWETGRYDILLRTGAWNRTYYEPFFICNNLPQLLRDNITRYINTSGLTRIDITGMIIDLEDGSNLQWNVSDPMLDIPFSLKFNTSENRSFLDVYMEDNVTFNDTIKIIGYDMDGSGVEVKVLLVINTTKIIEEIIEVDMRLDVTGPSSIWSANVTLNFTFQIENNGNIPLSFDLNLLGNGSSYLKSFDTSFTLFPGEIRSLNFSFDVDLEPGYNYFGFGVEAFYEENDWVVWRNYTVIRNIEDDGDPDLIDSDIPWILLGFGSSGFLLLVAILILLFVVIRKKKSNDLENTPDENHEDEIFDETEFIEEDLSLQTEMEFPDQDRIEPLIPEALNDPFGDFVLPDDQSEPQMEDAENIIAETGKDPSLNSNEVSHPSDEISEKNDLQK